MTKPIYRLIDCFSPLTAADAKALASAGYHGVIRYLGAKTNPQWAKGLTPEELHDLSEAGLKVVFNWEGNPTFAGYFTAAQAHRDANDALTEMAWLGIVPGQDVAIYFSIDCNLAPNSYDAMIAYFREVKQIIGDKYKVGAYGSNNVLQALSASDVKADYYWQTIAWSGGRLFNHANLYQDKVEERVAGVNVDIDEVYVEPGWWPVDPPKPKPVVERWNCIIGWFGSEEEANTAAKDITTTHHWHTWVEKAQQ